MFTVGKAGSRIMKFSSDFNKYARETLHITNPFPRYHEDISKYCSTNSINIEESAKHDEETRVEREEWIRLRDRYIAKRILRELGYDVLIGSHYSGYYPDAIPCEDPTRQCHLNCPYFGNCCYKSQHTIFEN